MLLVAFINKINLSCSVGGGGGRESGGGRGEGEERGGMGERDSRN